MRGVSSVTLRGGVVRGPGSPAPDIRGSRGSRDPTAPIQVGFPFDSRPLGWHGRGLQTLIIPRRRAFLDGEARTRLKTSLRVLPDPILRPCPNARAMPEMRHRAAAGAAAAASRVRQRG